MSAIMTPSIPLVNALQPFFGDSKDGKCRSPIPAAVSTCVVFSLSGYYVVDSATNFPCPFTNARTTTACHSWI